MVRLQLLCAAAMIALGAFWLGLELRDVAHYGDTVEYVRLASTLEVDAYRGIVYPAFLAGLAALPGGEGILAPIITPTQGWHVGGPCDLSPAFVRVQLIQVLFAALAFGAYLHAFFGGAGRSKRALALLLGLVLFDPLVAHLNLSIMTDGLALSGTALFCAALGAWRSGRWPRWVALVVLLVAFLLTAGLRAEKKHVFVAVTVLTPCVWWWIDRGAEEARSALRTALPVVAGLVGFLAVSAVQDAFHRDQGRWPLKTTILHQRVAFPNLVATYDLMPADVRRVINPQTAEFFDAHHRNGRDVMNVVTRGDAELRDRLVADMARVAWQERWPYIVGDVLRDTLENVLATPSFYVRLATHAAVDRERFFEIFYSDGTRWTYTRLEEHHPEVARPYLVASGALFVVALMVGASRWRRSPRKLPTSEQWAMATPVVLVVLVNAAAFALTQDLVHIRYAAFAHVSMLLWLYSSSSSPSRETV